MALTYIGSSQAIIDSAGDYTIDRDLTQTSPTAHCVIINPGVNFVNIHLRSRLVGAGGSGSTNAGIFGNNNAAVSIMGEGGSIRGFAYGILMSNNCNLTRITNVFVQDALFRGIRVEGPGPYIANNDIRNVMGATWTPSAYVFGIETFGVANPGSPTILNNSIQTVHGTTTGSLTGESVGISVTDFGNGGVVQGNSIINDFKLGLSSGAGHTFGIWVGGASSVASCHNTIQNWDTGATYSSPTSGVIDDNVFYLCTTPQSSTQPAVTLGQNS